MLTLVLRDHAGLRMSFFVNIVWLLVYIGTALFDFTVLISVLLYCVGVFLTYISLERWNRLNSSILLSRNEFRIIVRPETHDELKTANLYRLPFFFLIWTPTSAGFILFGQEMVAEIGIFVLMTALLLSQLVLFDFINLEIRSRIFESSKKAK